jgi:hypothetical protein
MYRIIVISLVLALAGIGAAGAVPVYGPLYHTWWCSSGRMDRPDMASVNVNYDFSVYPSGVLPEVYVYNKALFLSATGAAEAPELKDLSAARFVWTSKAVSGNITEGARIYLGAGCKLPSDISSWDDLYVRVYARMKVNVKNRLDEIHLRFQTENDSVDSSDQIGDIGSDDTYATVAYDFASQDLQGDDAIYVTVNITGTDTAANVGLTIVDVEYIAVELVDIVH